MFNVKVFIDNGNIEKEVSDYMDIPEQYFKEEFNNYIECEGSWGTTDKNITYEEVGVYGFIIESYNKRYEVIPISIMNDDLSEVLEIRIMVVEL